jgi:hypothetical protein
MMTENVKQFIEENITTIEQEDWQKLFDAWYFTYSMIDRDVDFKQLKELFDIFRESGINLAKESETARESLIVKYMHEYVEEMQFMQEETVSWAGAINNLHSRLGVNLLDTKKLFEAVCDSNGLEPTTDDKLRYKLK